MNTNWLDVLLTLSTGLAVAPWPMILYLLMTRGGAARHYRALREWCVQVFGIGMRREPEKVAEWTPPYIYPGLYDEEEQQREAESQRRVPERADQGGSAGELHRIHIIDIGANREQSLAYAQQHQTATGAAIRWAEEYQRAIWQLIDSAPGTLSRDNGERRDGGGSTDAPAPDADSDGANERDGHVRVNGVSIQIGDE